MNLTNQFMGYAPEFEMILANTFRNELFLLKLNSCTMGMISVPTKQEDFWGRTSTSPPTPMPLTLWA